MTLVAGLDEPAERNFVRKHVLPTRRSEPSSAGDWRRATARIFGGRPGTYGAGILQLVDVRNWRDDADLAEVYVAWGGHAYGRGLRRRARRATRCARQFARIDVAVKNLDNREHDLFDSDDYFAEHGGMIAYVRHLAGARPARGHRRLGRPGAPARALAGRGGAARVPLARGEPALDRLDDAPRLQGRVRAGGHRRLPVRLRRHRRRRRGLDVRAGDRALRRLDEEVRDFLRRSNPWALRAIAERLLEAAERGLWEAPEPPTLEALRERATWTVEGELEEARRT